MTTFLRNTLASKETYAYFCMEIAINENIPNYAGGLGILAGDTLLSARDMGIRMIGVTLLYKEGFFRQEIGFNGEQLEKPEKWDPYEHLEKLPQEFSISFQNRDIIFEIFQYTLNQKTKVIFLNTDNKKNHPKDRLICKRLYNKTDKDIFLQQMILLGIAGEKALQILGYDNIKTYHINEAHSGFLTLALKAKELSDEEVRSKCVFTIHTPLKSAHPKIPLDLLKKYLPKGFFEILPEQSKFDNSLLLADMVINYSKYTNSVSKRNQQKLQKMYPNQKIETITNGINVARWVSLEMKKLFDKYIDFWKKHPVNLEAVNLIPDAEILSARASAKKRLEKELKKTCNEKFDSNIFTIGFARRFVTYKRADFIFRDPKKLNEIAEKYEGIQIVFSGKAPKDQPEGRDLLKKILQYKNSSELSKKIKIFFLPNYNIKLAKILIPGVDLWLNNPIIPLEASGTSGMKGALNGVPHLSTLDGWWKEGAQESVTGWTIGKGKEGIEYEKEDLKSLYHKLEEICDIFYNYPEEWLDIQKNTISINGKYFNTNRMLGEYIRNAYQK
jgi:starch phosphorylase